MFGGLELKGSTKKDDSKKADASDAASSTASSGFSFLNSFASAPTAAATLEPTTAHAPAPSAFSFLFSGSPEPATVNDGDAFASAETAKATTSSFGFISNATTSAKEEDDTPAPEAPSTTLTSFRFLSGSAASPVTNEEVTTTSSFSFLQPTTAIPDLEMEKKLEPVESLPSSSFGFMTSTTVAPEIATTSVAGIGLQPSSPSRKDSEDLAAPVVINTTASAPLPVISSGITFVSTAKPAKVIKKRTRTAVIGTAKTGVIQLPEPQPAHPAATSTVESLKDPDTRQSALDAARRAEEFMNEKIKEIGRQQSREEEGDEDDEVSRGQRTASSSSSTGHGGTEASTIPSSFKPLTAINSVDSDDSDGIIAAARAAAEEAHKLESSKQSSSSNIFGGLFRSRTSPQTSQHGSSNAVVPGSPPGRTPSGGSSRKTVNKSSLASVPSASSSSLEEKHSNENLTQQQAQRTSTVSSKSKQDRVTETATATTKLYTTDLVPETSYEHKNIKPPISVIPVPLPPSKQVQQHAKQLPTVDILSIPAPLTPFEKCSAMIGKFQNQIVKCMGEMKRCRQHRVGLLNDRQATESKLRLATQQKNVAEAQQTAAAEAEDFELADQLSVAIEQHEREEKECTKILENIQRALDQLESQKFSTITSITNHFSDIRNEMIEFQKLTESEDTKDATEKLQQFSLTSKLLSAEHDRLQHDLKHIERDTALVADERNEIEKAISIQSGEFEKQRDETRSKLLTVEEEIEELRNRLAAKQAIAAQLRTDAAGYEESILKVRVKFARQLTRVQKKEMELQDTQREWEFEKQAHEAQKRSHDQQVRTHSEALLERDLLLERLNQEIVIAKDFQSKIDSKEIDFELQQKSSSNNSSTTLAQLQAEVVKAEAAKNEAQVILKTASVAYRNLEAEIHQLEKRIPELEEIKKAAAVRRDFKTAGSASKEIKDSQARLKQIQEELLDDAKEKVEASENDVVQWEIELQRVQALANEEEELNGISMMQAIASAIHKLIATKQSIGNEKSTKPENEEGGECEDVADKTERNDSKNNTSILEVGTFIIDEQINALIAEGQSYGAKFGKWDDEFMPKISALVETETTATTNACTALDHNNNTDEAPSVNSTDVTLVIDDSTIAKINSDVQIDEEIPPNMKSSLSSSKEKMTRFRDLTLRLKSLEEELEKAVADDDFDQAAALDETLQQLLLEINELNMTDQEMETALSFDEDEEEQVLAESGGADSSNTKDVCQDGDDNMNENDSNAESSNEDAQPTNEGVVTPEKSDDAVEANLSSGSNISKPEEEEEYRSTSNGDDAKIDPTSNGIAVETESVEEDENI